MASILDREVSAAASDTTYESLQEISDGLFDYDAWEHMYAGELELTGTSEMPVTPSRLPAPGLPAPGLPGPSHQYDKYRQQTPFVPGAVADVMAHNASAPTWWSGSGSGRNLDNLHLQGRWDPNFDAGTQFGPTDSPSPSQTAAAPGADLSMPLYRTSPDQRIYPGMHQQNAAMARARSQRAYTAGQAGVQEEPGSMYQYQQPSQDTQASCLAIDSSVQDVDAVRRETISQVIGTMRSKPSEATAEISDSQQQAGLSPVAEDHEDEDEDDGLDDDERLLKSEAVKKMTSKERRQLRNKLSARHFRERRKQLLMELERDVATLTEENKRLVAQNRALANDNKQLTDLVNSVLPTETFARHLNGLVTDPSGMLHSQFQPPGQSAAAVIQPGLPSRMGQQHPGVPEQDQQYAYS